MSLLRTLNPAHPKRRAIRGLGFRVSALLGAFVDVDALEHLSSG